MIFTLSGVVALVSTLLLPGAASVTADLSAPPSEPAVLDVYTIGGSGCPPGTTSISVLPDNTGFQIVFTGFRAVHGGGDAGPTDFRKNCSVGLVVHPPQGYTYAIARADYSGSLHLEPGAGAVQRANYYSSGVPQDRRVTHTFAGPLDDAWQTTDITEPADLIYVPCGGLRSLNINTELRVNAGSTTDLPSWISMHASGSQVHTTFQFAWRQC